MKRPPLKWAWRICLAFAGLCAIVFAIWPWYRFHINVTKSLPGHLYLVEVGRKPSIGDIVAFTWDGGFGYPKGSTFLKHVYGLPGQSVEVHDRSIYIEKKLVARALERSHRGTPMKTVTPGPIPNQRVFAATPSPGGFDSRYEVFGLVSFDSIVGVAHEIF
jgi:conjugal transfer pilin signal peptidase TrbI